MNNKLGLTSILTPLVLMIWLNSGAPDARVGWELIHNTGHFNSPAFESDGERLYLGTRNGIHVSDNDGANWRQTDMPRGVDFLEIADDAIYAFTGSDFGLFRSDDRGESVVSGVYFYTLTAGKVAGTRKMLIQTISKTISLATPYSTLLTKTLNSAILGIVFSETSPPCGYRTIPAVM